MDYFTNLAINAYKHNADFSLDNTNKLSISEEKELTKVRQLENELKALGFEVNEQISSTSDSKDNFKIINGVIHFRKEVSSANTHC